MPETKPIAHKRIAKLQAMISARTRVGGDGVQKGFGENVRVLRAELARLQAGGHVEAPAAHRTPPTAPRRLASTPTNSSSLVQKLQAEAQARGILLP